MATSRREKIVAAARKGMGALGFYFVDPQIAVEWVHHYYEVFEREAVAVGLAANPSIALNIGMHAAPTRKQAVEQYQAAFDLFGSQTVHYYRDGEHVPGVTSPTEIFEAQKAANGAPVQVEWNEKEPAGIGTVDNIMALCEIYEDASLDELLIMPQMASNISHEDAMASLELIGTPGDPGAPWPARGDRAARQKWKAELAEKAVARRTRHLARRTPTTESTRSPRHQRDHRRSCRGEKRRVRTSSRVPIDEDRPHHHRGADRRRDSVSRLSSCTRTKSARTGRNTSSTRPVHGQLRQHPWRIPDPQR